MRVPDDRQDASESQWDTLHKENRRKQERLQRAIEERLAGGDDVDGVFEAALRDEGIIDLPEESSFSEAEEEFEETWEAEEDEPWRESLPEAVRGGDEDADWLQSDRHPLQRRAMDLMGRLYKLGEDVNQSHRSQISALHRSAGEIMGGLAQALGTRRIESDGGLSVVQLKRAMRGAAFTLGSLFALRAEGGLPKAVFAELHDTIESLQADILEELRRVRGQG